MAVWNLLRYVRISLSVLLDIAFKEVTKYLQGAGHGKETKNRRACPLSAKDLPEYAEALTRVMGNMGGAKGAPYLIVCGELKFF